MTGPVLTKQHHLKLITKMPREFLFRDSFISVKMQQFNQLLCAADTPVRRTIGVQHWEENNIDFSWCVIFRYGESFPTSSWDFHHAYICGTLSLARGGTSQSGPAKYLWCSLVLLSITRFISMLFIDRSEK